MLAEGLVHRGHATTIISLHAEREERIDERNGVRVYRLPLANHYWPFSRACQPWYSKLLWHLRDRWNQRADGLVGRILDSEKPNVVHTHNLSGFSVAPWAVARRRGIRVVHTTHDYYLLCVRSTLFRGDCVCDRQCADCSFFTRRRIVESGSLDAAIGVSRRTLDLHRQFGCFRDVPCYVVSNIFPTCPMVQTSGSSTFRGETVIGYIGLIDKKKGLETLLQSVMGLRGRDWILKIAGAGEGGYVERLRLEYRDPRIHWLGYTAPNDFYRSVDIVVVPSLWEEPRPYVCLEALHAGKRVIYSESGGLPELGALSELATGFPPGDTVCLTEKLEAAADHGERRKSTASFSAAWFEALDEERILDEHLKIYEGWGSLPT